MEMSSVTSSAPSTDSVPPSVRTVPRSASALARARKRTSPFRPWVSPLTPSSAIVSLPAAEALTFCGLEKAAWNVTEPGWSALSRTTMTWSGLPAKTSRVCRTPSRTKLTEVTAVVRSSSRR
ncbi:hypothetical protein GCM10020001_076540 [Nonomuraea salmonea]